MITYRIGILHSLSGTMAESEKPLVDACLLAIDEINSKGGVLGRLIEPVIEDGSSNPEIFQQKAEKIIKKDNITTIFGCWTSFSRKAVKPVIEKYNALLWYPVQYEGLECSPNIVYTGSCLNQQIYPALDWLIKNQKKHFFLLGSDYVFPRTANKLIKAQLKRKNCKVVGEEYKTLGAKEFAEIIYQIRNTQPDIIFNTLNGDSNYYFYKEFYKADISPEETSIMAVSVAEGELQRIGNAAVGHYACWSYFQSLDTPENKQFISNFKSKYGSNRVTSDPIETAYSQLYLWKQTVEASNSFDISKLRQNISGQCFNSPGGQIRIEPNQHVLKNAHIGKILSDKQFEILWSSEKQIKPMPWLGLEELGFPSSNLLIDLFSEVSEGIHHSWLLERTTHALEKTNIRLKTEINNRKKIYKELVHKTKLIQFLQEITIASNEAMTVGEAMQLCLDRVCSFTGWPVGHVYMLDSTGKLIPTKFWYFENQQRFEAFRKITEITPFDPGVGLPGRVLESGKPAWIPDVAKDTNFLRAKLVKNIGFKAGLAFPVLEGKKVAAILEFFFETSKKPDGPLLDAISNLGTLLGRVTERKRAEEEKQIGIEAKKRLAVEMTLNKKLQQALDKIKTLRGLLPICANCKKIRDDQGYWNQIEVYIANHSEADFSHGICPECSKKLYPEFQ